MSSRLITRIGRVDDGERAPDALDVTGVVEPASGAEARTRGSLYLLAQVWGADPRLRAAAREVLAELQDHYHHDLTSGPAGALANALGAANRGVYHRRARLGIPADAGIGIVALVIRGRGASAVRLGPPAALMVRDGRISELPPRPAVAERGPRRAPVREATSLGEALEIDPYRWQGQLAAGDRVALVSRGIIEKLGAEELGRALSSMRPDQAAQHLARLFAARGGGGSDGLLVLELAEAPVTVSPHRPRPVRLAQPPAGRPDRRPAPLADAFGSLVRRAGRAAGDLGSALGRTLIGLLKGVVALVPAPRPELPRVERTWLREEAHRRRRGLLGIVAVALLLSLGIGVAGLPGIEPTEAIPRASAARQAVLAAGERLAEVRRRVDGQDLVARDPDRAATLLQEAYAALERAVGAGVAPAELASLRAMADRATDSLHRVTRLSQVDLVLDLATVFGVVDPVRMVAAADGSLWLIDAARGRLVRIEPQTGAWRVVLRAGGAPGPGTPTAGEPWLLATAADGVVVADRLRQAWRIGLEDLVPRPMELNGIDAIPSGAELFAALQHRPPLRIFTLYLLDPRDGVLKWTPPPVLPVHFPQPPERYLTEDPDLPAAEARSMIADANLWLLHKDTVTRVSFGRPLSQDDYRLDPPPGGDLRTPLDYRLIDAATVADRELLYVHDAANARIIAFGRGDGAFVRQWLAVRDGPQAGLLDEVRALVVDPAIDGPPVAYLLTADRVLRVVLD